MILTKLCFPALIYLIFFIVQVLIEMSNNNINGAILQLISGILITLLLEVLCIKGLNIVSWIIVFIPFIFYTYITFIIYYAFNVNPKNSKHLKQYLVK
tara:strand:- start:107 stop:400 length:294 start_codon:yes stop_codon:yes gene_type:complete